MGFSHSNAAQSLTANGRTEDPLRRAGGPVVPFVASRTMATEFLAQVALGIALGRLGDARRGMFTLPLPVSPRLLPPTFLARRTRPILLIGKPLRPATRRTPTHGAAITTVRMMRYEPLFAPFQKAKTSSRADGRRPLILRPQTGIMKEAQGRSCSRKVKSRGGAATSPRDAFLLPRDLRRLHLSSTLARQLAPAARVLPQNCHLLPAATGPGPVKLAPSQAAADTNNSYR